ncbi:hypothetical protein [Faecalimonas sp.]
MSIILIFLNFALFFKSLWRWFAFTGIDSNTISLVALLLCIVLAIVPAAYCAEREKQYLESSLSRKKQILILCLFAFIVAGFYV